jgi:feruloyl-CoA synthase
VEVCRREAALAQHATAQEISRSAEVCALLAKRLNAFNLGKTTATSRVEGLMVSGLPLSPEHYEVTDKGSVNQRAVVARRSAEIQQLYATPLVEGVIAAEPATTTRLVHRFL